MEKMDKLYTNRKIAASVAGAEVGAIIAGALTDLSAMMAKGVDSRVIRGAPDDAEAALMITFDFDVSTRVNAIAQILVPVVDEIAVQHERQKADCADECAERLLYNFLMEAMELALAQSKANRTASAQGKAAKAMLDDTDPAGSSVAEAAQRKLDELLAKLRKGH